MESSPPRSNSRKILLFSLLAAASIAAAAYTLGTHLFSPENSAKNVSAPKPPSHPEPPSSLPLRNLDVDKLAAQYLDNQDYFRRLDAATLAEYDKLNPPDSAWYVEGRQAARLMALFIVWNDFYGQGILQAADADAATACHKGCHDPLISTICDVFIYASAYSTVNAGAQAHIARTRKLIASHYPPIFKMTTIGIALKNLTTAKQNPGKLKDDFKSSWAQIPALSNQMVDQFGALLDERPPADFLYFRLAQLLDDIDDNAGLETVGNGIDRAFDQFNPDDPARAAVRGTFLTKWAWQARGSGWASTVTAEGQRLMAERLDQASKILTAAYEKNPADYLSATEMLTVELGQGNGRDVMETWFRRAMKDHPDNYQACVGKEWYLQPRWYGSPDDVVEFGLGCAKSGNWKAKLPLILTGGINTLASQKEDLYRYDEVWNLVRPVYEEYLKHYPDSINTRTTYADCAARGNRLDVLREQLKILGPHWDRTVWTASDFRRVSKLAQTH